MSHRAADCSKRKWIAFAIFPNFCTELINHRFFEVREREIRLSSSPSCSWEKRGNQVPHSTAADDGSTIAGVIVRCWNCFPGGTYGGGMVDFWDVLGMIFVVEFWFWERCFCSVRSWFCADFVVLAGFCTDFTFPIFLNEISLRIFFEYCSKFCDHCIVIDLYGVPEMKILKSLAF